MDLLSLAKVILGIPFVVYLGYLFGADLVAGIAVAVATRSFDGQKVSDWLRKLVSPLLGFAAVVLLCLAQPQLESTAHLIEVAGASIAVSYLASIYENLKQLGIQLPTVGISESTPRPPEAKA